MLPQRITVIALAAAAAVLVAVAAILAGDASRADAQCLTTNPLCTRVVDSIRVTSAIAAGHDRAAVA